MNISAILSTNINIFPSIIDYCEGDYTVRSMIKRNWQYIHGINGLLLILYSIFVFSTYAYLIVYSNFPLTTIDGKAYLIRWVFLIMICSVICCPLLLKATQRIKISSHLVSKDNHSNIKWKMLFFGVPFLVSFFKYITYYPTAFSTDSFSQYSQAITNRYNDWHPVIQTLFSFKLPLTLTGGWIGSISLFQIFVLSLAISYSLLSLQKYTNNKYALFALLFIVLNPKVSNTTLYPWKDVPFAIGALLMTSFSLHIFCTRGNWIKRKANLILFIVVFALTTLFRHNALLFTIPLIIAVTFYLDKKSVMVICICAAALIAGIKGPLYSALNVESPDQRQVETLGLPMTIIGAAVTYTPELVDHETLDFAYKIAPRDVWEEKYHYGSYNDVKWDSHTNNDVIEEYGTLKVLTMALRCFKNCPSASLKGLIKITDVVYSMCDDYIYDDMPKIVGNQYGIVSHGIPLLQKMNYIVSKSLLVLFPWLFLYVGSMHFVIITSVLAKCKLNNWEDWKKILLVFPMFIYNYGTTLLLTGAEDSSRFFFYTFLLMPTLLVFLFRNNEEGSTGKPEQLSL